MQLKDATNSMFSFIWTQPIHVTLRQMRLIQVGLIVNSQILLWHIVDRLQNLADPMQVAGAYGAIAATLITSIWACVNALNKSNGQDS